LHRYLSSFLQLQC